MEYSFYTLNGDIDFNPQVKYHNHYDKIIKKVYYGTHGSGLDSRYTWYTKGRVLRLSTFFHVMNDNGFYVGHTPVTVWFSIDNPTNFKLSLSVNDNPFNACYGLRAYLEAIIINALDTE